MPVLELRVAVTTADFERLVSFYRDGLGVDPDQLWINGDDRAVLFQLGRATIEVFDEPHAAVVDQIEVGQRVSGPIRFAIEVPDVDVALDRLLKWGAVLVHEAVVTPWGDRNVRVQSPDGLQVTLFQPSQK